MAPRGSRSPPLRGARPPPPHRPGCGHHSITQVSSYSEHDDNPVMLMTPTLSRGQLQTASCTIATSSASPSQPHSRPHHSQGSQLRAMHDPHRAGHPATNYELQATGANVINYLTPLMRMLPPRLSRYLETFRDARHEPGASITADDEQPRPPQATTRYQPYSLDPQDPGHRTAPFFPPPRLQLPALKEVKLAMRPLPTLCANVGCGPPQPSQAASPCHGPQNEPQTPGSTPVV